MNFFNDHGPKTETCFAVEPGYHQLPARCKLSRGHDGQHSAGNEHYGPRVTWSDEETMP